MLIISFIATEINFIFYKYKGREEEEVVKYKTKMIEKQSFIYSIVKDLINRCCV